LARLLERFRHADITDFYILTKNDSQGALQLRTLTVSMQSVETRASSVRNLGNRKVKQVQTTVTLGLLLLLNCALHAEAEGTSVAGITSGATSATTQESKEAHDDREGVSPEVLLTISPAKVKHELIKQTALEDTAQNAQLAPKQNAVEQNTPRQIAQSVPTAPNQFGLNAITVSLAKEWGVYDKIEHLDKVAAQFKATQSTQDTLNYLLAKQKVTEELADLGYDVRRCTNAVDREIAMNSSKAAYLTELRDKAIRLNTYADFLAGGLTGILSGALELGDVSRFSYSTIDVVEGAAQAGLSAYAYKAEHSGDRTQGTMPNVLAAVVNPDRQHNAYPDSVRTFLNSPAVAGDATTSRIKSMLARWERLNFCLTHTGRHRLKGGHRLKHITGTHTEDATATIDLLEDRTAMLQDLRAEVTLMDEAVDELFDLCKKY
jgi:hypothetical protein